MLRSLICSWRVKKGERTTVSDETNEKEPQNRAGSIRKICLRNQLYIFKYNRDLKKKKEYVGVYLYRNSYILKERDRNMCSS